MVSAQMAKFPTESLWHCQLMLSAARECDATHSNDTVKTVNKRYTLSPRLDRRSELLRSFPASRSQFGECHLRMNEQTAGMPMLSMETLHWTGLRHADDAFVGTQKQTHQWGDKRRRLDAVQRQLSICQRSDLLGSCFCCCCKLWTDRDEEQYWRKRRRLAKTKCIVWNRGKKCRH